MDDFVAIVVFFALCFLIYTIVDKKKKGTSNQFTKFLDKYTTLGEVRQALRKAGVESSNLIIGIDFTKSNEWTGQRSFGGKCLHHLEQSVDPVDPACLKTLNPYQQVVSVLGRTLEAFDDDRIIPAWGFGDARTGDHSVFPLHRLESPGCLGFAEVLTQYGAAASEVSLSGPTSFAPLIRQAIATVRASRGQYHILVIVADGQVTSARETAAAIVEASAHPLSIVMVGVGDGPWDAMREFDDQLPSRRFDNFQFVDFTQTMRRYDGSEAAFALAALMEIPDQYKAICKLGLLG